MVKTRISMCPMVIIAKAYHAQNNCHKPAKEGCKDKIIYTDIHKKDASCAIVPRETFLFFFEFSFSSLIFLVSRNLFALFQFLKLFYPLCSWSKNTQMCNELIHLLVLHFRTLSVLCKSYGCMSFTATSGHRGLFETILWLRWTLIK